MTTIEKLLKYMKAKNISLTEVSRKTGIPYQRMHKWTSGANLPKTEDSRILEDYMNGKSPNIVDEDKAVFEVPNSLQKVVDMLQQALQVITTQQQTISDQHATIHEMISDKKSRLSA